MKFLRKFGVYERCDMFLCMYNLLYFILLKLKLCNCVIILRLFTSKILNLVISTVYLSVKKAYLRHLPA